MEGFPEFVSGISKLANLSDSGEPDWESTHGVIHIVDFFSNKDEIVYGKLDLSIGDILSDIPEYSYIDENGITHDQIGWSYVGHDSDFNMQYGNLVVLKDTLGKLTNGNSYPIYIMPKFHYKVTFKTESIENETYE